MRAIPTALVAAVSLFLLAFALAAPAQDPKAPATEKGAGQPPILLRPLNSEGKPLNLDFEAGDLSDWTVEGEAFAKQPIEGDTVAKRRQDMKSGHQGKYWLGGYEQLLDAPQGTLTSVPFKVTHPWASFLVAGGPHETTCVEIVSKVDNKLLLRASGRESEELYRVSVDLREYIGKEILIRVVDRHSGHWGHVNFDDFQFHTDKPKVEAKSAGELQEFAGLSPDDAAKAMKVPEGFKVTAFAGEPDIVQPIAMTIDDRGRLWVAEAYSYPVKVPAAEARDRIVILEDADNDGKFDKRTVFAEKLNLISGLEVGFGGAWVGAAPELLFIPDRNGDDIPDSPAEVILDGWGMEDTHETLNSFIWGPDGWLYGCHGVFTKSLVGRPGTPPENRKEINAGIFRFHPTRREFEVFAYGTSNPWGVDFNDHGQAFLSCCVIPHLFHVIQGARYQRQAGEHMQPYTYADIPTIAKHRHWVGNQWNEGDRAKSDANGGGHAHAGAMIYLGGRWPQQYRNQLFMNNIHGARINEDVLLRDGSGYVGDAAPDFCYANDRWSQILYLRYGPDGGVYMIDWYDANQCHHRNTDGHDRTNGRVFKITYEPKTVEESVVWKPVDLQKLSDRELIENQLHPNDWFVRGSRRVLQERAAAGKLDKDTHQALTQLAFGHEDETRRLRGLWALHVTSGLTEELLDRALEHETEFERAWAIQFACEKGVPSDKILGHFSTMSRTDVSPVVRLYLASALQRIPVDKRWEILVGLLSHGEDAADHNLPLMLWYAAEPLAVGEPVKALELALDGFVPVVKTHMVRRLAAMGTPELLSAIVAELARPGEPGEPERILNGLQAGLRGRRQVPMPAGWEASVEKLKTSDSPEIQRMLEGLSVTFGDPAAIARLRTRMADTATPLDQRKDALATLLAAKDASLLPLLKAFLDQPPMRNDALRALAAYDDAETPSLILGKYPELTGDERRSALNTLASRASYAQPMLEAVARKQILATDLTADLVRQVRNLKQPALDTLITEHWGVLRDTPEEKAKLIAEYKDRLGKRGSPPDVALGRALFQKTCAQCHTLFGVGSKVGPELTGSNRGNLDYLLSNVLDPSAVVGKDYQPTIFSTNNGRTITGLIKMRDENSYTIVTATETLVLPKSEIDEQKISDKSMMPDDLLKAFSEQEVRALVAYLASPTQTPLRATAENAVEFFNGRDLKFWEGDESLWKVENGELIGTSPGLKRNEFLRSHFLGDNFRLTFEVKLTPNAGNSGVQFRSQPLPDGEMQGYQADIGAGWWGKLYEENGRALLWKLPGDAHVKPDEWNQYEIQCENDHVRTVINGNLCVDLSDPKGARSGIFALQLHSGEPFTVRFRALKLDVLNMKPNREATLNKLFRGE